MHKKYYIIYKPYGMLSQFTKEVEGQRTLADLDFEFEKDVYPVGRLDADSEGLLLLTNDKSLNAALLHPKKKTPKTYWAQVEGIPSTEALAQLEKGVALRIKKKTYQTLPAAVRILEPQPTFAPRVPPIRVRASIPDTWIAIKLIEGKNRQVRRMCAAVGFPVLRLVRVSFGGFFLGKNELEGMVAGDVRAMKY